MRRKQPDFRRWEEEIKSPFWYRKLVPEFQELMRNLQAENEEYFEICKEAIYKFFETNLLNGAIALAESGEDWDRERKQIDTIVIHHTSNPPGMRPSRLSAIELIRLYAPQYAKKQEAKGIFSAHFRNGRQVFYPYHWFVRQDGTVERLLFDSEIGWHAGNWDVNCRSVAICFDNDLEDTRPSDIELAAAARIIREQYPDVLKERVLGHCEVKAEITCPSRLFLSTGTRKGWKEDLLEMF